MEAVRDGAMFGLRSPKTDEVLREVNARQLWQRILETRLQTGEPYILNIDAVNRALPKHQRELGLKVNTSNLCSEITLPTGIDHRRQGPHRGLLPVLAQHRDLGPVGARSHGFVEDVLRMLDNVLTSFIETAPDGMERAQVLRPARTLGRPGRDGLSLLPAGQGHSRWKAPWPSRGICASSSKIRREADAASYILAEERGACPDAAENGA